MPSSASCVRKITERDLSTGISNLRQISKEICPISQRSSAQDPANPSGCITRRRRIYRTIRTRRKQRTGKIYAIGYYDYNYLKIGDQEFETSNNNNGTDRIRRRFFDESTNRLSWRNWGISLNADYRVRNGYLHAICYYSHYGSYYRQKDEYQTDLSDPTTYGYTFSSTRNSITDIGLPFTDEEIEGQTHTLIVKEIVQGDSGRDPSQCSEMKRKFKLFAISENYYQYLLRVLYNDTYSDELHGRMIDMGMTEPLPYFSNIKGGIGIFAAYVLDEVELDILQTVGEFPQSVQYKERNK